VNAITFRPMQHDDLEWLQLRTNAAVASDAEGVVANIDGARGGIAVAERWSETGAWVHIVVDDPRVLMGNALLDQVADYVFGTHGKRFMFTTTSSENEPSLKFQRGLGFREVGRIEHGFDLGEDLIIMRLDAVEWRRKRGH
jgi:L-amino acid N-acyltransferase YncA